LDPALFCIISCNANQWNSHHPDDRSQIPSAPASLKSRRPIRRGTIEPPSSSRWSFLPRLPQCSL
jgi:hypothetical protein